tara:strand:- start:4007 stop:4747 length:741 start_codon:yes stop_codon:yes gene_type:complete
MSKIIVDEIQTNTTNGNVRIKPNGTGVLEVDGSCTATTFSGSGASLTSIPAANLTGALPAIDGSNLTGVGGGGALEFVSKTTISSSTYTVDFTGLDYGYIYKLYSKKVLLSGQIQANNEVFFIRFFLNGGSSVMTTSNGYQYRNNAISSDNTHYNGYTNSIPMFQPYSAFTRCALDIEFSTDYYGWAEGKLFATSDETPYNIFAGSLNNSAHPQASNRISGIRIYFQYTYDIEPGSEFLLYRYKES